MPETNSNMQTNGESTEGAVNGTPVITWPDAGQSQGNANSASQSSSDLSGRSLDYEVDPGYTFPDYPSGSGTPVITFPSTSIPSVSFPSVSIPPVTYYSQVRFMNASTNGLNLDVYIDNQNVFSGSTFATVSVYVRVSDGFHTVTVRRTNGPILYQQMLAFISGEKSTMVILDTSSGVTLTKVSDMGCTNVPSGYGCLRVANMSYTGSNYDVRTFNNQVAFSGVGYKEVTSYKQTSAGSYTFFVTNSQVSFGSFNELSVIILTALVGSCSSCGVSNPLLTFNINVQARRAYTSYIIGNPWSNLFQVYTLED